MAEELGKRLLSEFEESGLDELLDGLRQSHDETPASTWNLPQLNNLSNIAVEARQANLKAAAGLLPCIELTSLHPGGGSTHLLYHIAACAIDAPANGTVVIIDTDGSFSVPHLAQFIKARLIHTGDTHTENQSHVHIVRCLKHVHIYRPQSLASTVATIQSLPEYLFHGDHHSHDRAVSFLALHSASAFFWQEKAAAEDAAVLRPSKEIATPSERPAGYAELAAALKEASRNFCCPVIATSWHLGAVPASGNEQENRSLRPSLPHPWPMLPTLRLIVQRKPVKKFPVGISVEQALREASDRITAVEDSKFEAYVNEWGMDERTLQKLQRVGAGFGFRITSSGVQMD